MNILLKYNLRNLWQRKVRTSLTILGIATVVMLFVTMRAMSIGLSLSYQATGSSDNVEILEMGAWTMALSTLCKDVLNVIKYIPHVKVKDGEELLSPECYIASWVRKKGDNNQDKFILIRGVNPIAFNIYHQVKIIEGKKPNRSGEVIIGKMIPSMFKGKIKLGDKIIMERKEWTIVGIFDTEGSAYEGEIWTDLNDLMIASNRNTYSCITLKVDTPSNVNLVCNILNNSKQIDVKAMPEKDYYITFSEEIAAMGIMGLIISIIAMIGAILGSINTMYSAVTSRIREIGTLRILGFSQRTIISSFMMESLIIAIIGGIIGGIFALPCNKMPMNIIVYGFYFKITPTILLQGLILSIIIGILGGFLPTRAIFKLRVVEAMRHI